MSLEIVERFHVPRHIAQETEKALRLAGQQGFELFMLWSGVVQGNVFEVRTCHRPRQTAYKLASGLCVRVDGEELHRLNRWLFDHGEILGVQVHSHPTNAFHSPTDDTFPIVTLLGGLSIVVPDFCQNGLGDEGTVTYRLQPHGWVEVPLSAAHHLFNWGT